MQDTEREERGTERERERERKKKTQKKEEKDSKEGERRCHGATLPRAGERRIESIHCLHVLCLSIELGEVL